MVQISIAGLDSEAQKVKCCHCGRWIKKHLVINGLIYGPTCAKTVIQKSKLTGKERI